MMELNLTVIKAGRSVDIDTVAALIVNSQQESGEIPWCEGEKTDP